jgi:hypothetical protein
MLEQIADAELVDASHLLTPRSQELEEFRDRYLKDIRSNQDAV